MLDILFDIIDVIFMSNLAGKVTEEDIQESMQFLKNQQWFQNYLVDDRARHLIVHDKDVRHLIGRCRIKRMTGSIYEQRFEKRFNRLITSKLSA